MLKLIVAALLRDDQDQNRPFIVEGKLSDDELMSVVAFVRPRPPLIGAGPIQAIVADTNDSVTVWTRLGPQAWDRWKLQKLGDTWQVVQRGRGQA